jgi:hypothetical protein
MAAGVGGGDYLSRSLTFPAMTAFGHQPRNVDSSQAYNGRYILGKNCHATNIPNIAGAALRLKRW